MSSTHRIRLFVAACVAGLCWAGFGSLTSSAAGKEYRVQFDRKEKAGQTSKVTVSGAHQQTVGMNGAPMDQKAYKYELTATREVQKVDADGQAVQVSLTVAQCKVIRGGKQADEVKPGAVVIVTSSGGKPRVEPKDSSVKLTDDAKAILGRAANVESAGGSGDKAFGTDKPRQIGESWPVNSKYIAESLSKMLAAEIAGAGRFAAVPTLKEKDVTGRVTLAGASRVGGVECLDLRQGREGRDDDLPDRKVPGGRVGSDADWQAADEFDHRDGHERPVQRPAGEDGDELGRQFGHQGLAGEITGSRRARSRPVPREPVCVLRTTCPNWPIPCCRVPAG